MSTVARLGVIGLLTVAAASAVALPRLDRRVVDETGVLGAAAQARLESTLATYEQRTGHQFAVVILGGLDGEVLEQVSLRLAEQWRLGDARRDDGLLVVVAMKERAVRVEVGYGLEGVVTDALASRVIRDRMAPRFAQGDFAGGLDAGIAVLMRAAEGESVGAAPVGTVRNAPPTWLQLAPLLFFVAMTVLGAFARRRVGRGQAGAGSGAWAALMLLAALGGGRGGAGGGGFFGGGGGFGGGGASGRW